MTNDYHEHTEYIDFRGPHIETLFCAITGHCTYIHPNPCIQAETSRLTSTYLVDWVLGTSLVSLKLTSSSSFTIYPQRS